jgi:copper chaperone
MKTTKFKTNIKCAACVEKVTPYLNETIGANQWKVDLTDPSRVLTAEHEVDQKKVNEALAKIGYKVEQI